MAASTNTRPIRRVSVLGTGTMGAAMATRLARAGFDVPVWNRTAAKARALSDTGARPMPDITSAVRGSDVVITMLFDLDAVLEAAEELLPAAAEGAIWMQSSTVGKAGAETAAARAGAVHVTFVDAPVLGTKGPAENGELTVLASGDESAIARLAPVFDVIGSRSMAVGAEPGAASALKIAVNAWVASLTAATAQSLAIAQASGIEPGLFLDAIAGSASDSAYAHVKGAAMLARDYPTQFAVDGILKDVELAIEARGGAADDMLTSLQALYRRAHDLGDGGSDIAAVYEAFIASSADAT